MLSKYKIIPLGVLISTGLYAAGTYNYPLFHISAELFSVVAGFGIFMLARSCRRFMDNDYLILPGIASLFIGSVLLIRTLALQLEELEIGSNQDG